MIRFQLFDQRWSVFARDEQPDFNGPRLRHVRQSLKRAPDFIVQSSVMLDLLGDLEKALAVRHLAKVRALLLERHRYEIDPKAVLDAWQRQAEFASKENGAAG